MTAPALPLRSRPSTVGVEIVDGQPHELAYRTDSDGEGTWRRCVTCLPSTSGAWSTGPAPVLHAGDGPSAALAAMTLMEEK